MRVGTGVDVALTVVTSVCEIRSFWIGCELSLNRVARTVHDGSHAFDQIRRDRIVDEQAPGHAWVRSSVVV